MSITIELAPDLERQIRQAAAKAGLPPDEYIVETLRARVGQASTQPSSQRQLTPAKASLLLKINQSLSHVAWSRYHDLIAKRHAETLTEDEQLAHANAWVDADT
jgi:hypothetical protein